MLGYINIGELNDMMQEVVRALRKQRYIKTASGVIFFLSMFLSKTSTEFRLVEFLSVLKGEIVFQIGIKKNNNKNPRRNESLQKKNNIIDTIRYTAPYNTAPFKPRVHTTCLNSLNYSMRILLIQTTRIPSDKFLVFRLFC